jgi:hypothetical protein
MPYVKQIVARMGDPLTGFQSPPLSRITRATVTRYFEGTRADAPRAWRTRRHAPGAKCNTALHQRLGFAAWQARPLDHCPAARASARPLTRLALVGCSGGVWRDLAGSFCSVGVLDTHQGLLACLLGITAASLWKCFFFVFFASSWSLCRTPSHPLYMHVFKPIVFLSVGSTSLGSSTARAPSTQPGTCARRCRSSKRPRVVLVFPLPRLAAQSLFSVLSTHCTIWFAVPWNILQKGSQLDVTHE